MFAQSLYPPPLAPRVPEQQGLQPWWASRWASPLSFCPEKKGQQVAPRPTLAGAETLQCLPGPVLGSDRQGGWRAR